MTKKPRIAITMSDELMKEVEDFRFENRYETKSEATAALIKYALEAIKKGEVSGDILREQKEV